MMFGSHLMLPPELRSTVSHVAAICLSLSSNVSGLFVFPQTCEFHMPQMPVRCPFHEFKLAYQFGLEPLATFHFVERQALSPSALSFFWKIGEGTDISRQRSHFR